jgi:molybdopterin synthase sulfur carrier subunit
MVVSLPTHLRRLAGLNEATVSLEVGREPTLGDVIDELERRYPALRGTIRDHSPPGGGQGPLRPFMRFFALDSDLTQDGLGQVLPPEVVNGGEVLRIIGAIAGG